jgi:Tol biopolymer transport system component
MIGDTAVVTVRSDDLAEPAIDVTCTGGPEIVPPGAGRYLYYWQIPNIFTGGDIVQLPLQGMAVAQPFWGPRTGKTCTGCHNVSPDGRYIAVVETAFRVIDTQSNISLALPNSNMNIAFLSWRPDVNTNPPYQYVWDDTQDLHLAALFDGDLGTLPGADDPGWYEQMPSWGPNGTIAYARSTMVATNSDGNPSWGLAGQADIVVIPETGGTPTNVPGASGNGVANYYPRFSPNGTFIAFTESASAVTTIAATDAQIRMVRSDFVGGPFTMSMVNGNNGASSFPTWSVDGSFLSFSSNRTGGAGDWDIYIAPVDTNTGVDGAALNVSEANTPAFEHSAQWSP